MFKIEFSEIVYFKVEKYAKNYSRFFESIYEDSGLIGEEEIINGYFAEAMNRQQEVLNMIEEKMSREIPSYTKNETFLKWRTKIIFVKFSDNGEIRRIENIEIR